MPSGETLATRVPCLPYDIMRLKPLAFAPRQAAGRFGSSRKFSVPPTAMTFFAVAPGVTHGPRQEPDAPKSSRLPAETVSVIGAPPAVAPFVSRTKPSSSGEFPMYRPSTFVLQRLFE